MRMGGGGLPIPVGSGIGGIVVVIIIIVVLNLMGGTGADAPSGGLQGGQGGAIRSLDPGDDPAQFVNSVTVDVQAFWDEQFRAAGQEYPETVTVLFTDQTQ
jgi:predicted metalloprotease